MKLRPPRKSNHFYWKSSVKSRLNIGLKRILSISLIVSLLSSAVQPAAAYAGPSAPPLSMESGYDSQLSGLISDYPDVPSDQSTLSDFDPHENVPIIEEKVELRESHIKHFLREDRSMEAVIYPVPVHYQKDGEWVDIDNRLESVSINGNIGYRNREGDYSVTFSEFATADEWVKIEKAGTSVSWRLSDEMKTVPALSESGVLTVNHSEAVVINGEKFSEDPRVLPNLSSTIIYPEVYQNVDVVYTMDSAGVREKLVIEQFSEAAENYSFDVTCTGLVPQVSGNVISLISDGKTVFTIQRPLITDGAGTVCTDVALQLIPVDETLSTYDLSAQLSDGGDVDMISGIVLPDTEEFTFTYRIIPSREWMDDPERVWPVTVDPDVIMGPAQITDTFVASGQPDYVLNTFGFAQVGTDGYLGVGRIYYRLNSLPALNPADLFVSAAVYVNRLNQENDGNPVILYPVTQDWNASGVCWNTKPSYDSGNAIAMAMSYPAGAYNHWNITELMKRWYNGEPNYGFMLKAENESVGKIEYHTAESSNSSAYPFVSVVYLNARGLENYWSYHSQSIGRAGVGYVNDATGSLTLLHQDMYVGGGSQEMSIVHVYNGHEREIDLGFGRGWRTGYTQHVAEETINGLPYYKHIDGDGTMHYYLRSSGNPSLYEHETDSHKTLLVEQGKVVIKDASGNQLKFDAYGRLHQIVDNNGNTQTITYAEDSYSSWKISSVTDADGNRTVFNYNSSNHLSGLDCSNGQDISFTYDSSGYLTGIIYADGKSTQYRYHSSGYLSSVRDHSGYKVFYDYGGTPVLKVTGIREYAGAGINDSDLSGATAGKSLTISYGVNVTSFTDNQGRTELVRFDQLGQPISVQDPEGRAAYGTYGLEADKTQTKLTSLSDMQKTSVNLLLNGNAGSTNGWSAYYNGLAGSDSYGRSTAEGFMGNDSLYLSKAGTGGYLYYVQEISAEAGKTYTFSTYLKGGENVQIGIQAYVNGAWENVAVTIALTDENTWNRSSVTGTIPAGAERINVIFGLFDGGCGTVYADCLQLEKGELSRYNLLSNSDFTSGTASWTGTGLTGGDTVGTIPAGGTHPDSLSTSGFKIVGAVGTEKYLSQTIHLSGNAGDSFVYGGWMKANSLALVHTSYGFYGLKQLQLLFMNGTTQVGYFDLNYQDDTEDWQYLCGEATAPAAYTSIVFKCSYSKNLGDAWFDGLQLYQEGFGERYTYADGNLTQIIDKEKKKTDYEYDSNHNVTKVTDQYGDVTTYTYDGNHNVLTATSLGTTTAFTYDGKGNVISTKVYGTNSSGTFLSSSAGYTTAGGYRNSLTDALGNTAAFSYDTAKGLLTASTDPLGNRTAYTYDAMGRMETVTAKDASGNTAASVVYGYSGDDLSTITRNGMSYGLVTDAFGNTTGISAAGNTLITNTYNYSRGLLTESTYGNGYVLTYEYDGYDRLTAVKEGGTVIYRAYYDGDGRLYRTTDEKTGVTSQYDYDLSGKLMRVAGSDGASYRYYYDGKDNLSGIRQTAGGKTWTVSYGYDSQYRPTTTKLENGKTVTNIYDSLSRLTKITYGLSSAYTVTLGYGAGANGGQSTQLSSYQNGSESAYQYTYDKNGNIKTITQNGKKVTYTYDSLNQLTREDNQFLNKTIVYAYDGGGNLTRKTEYAYTTGALGIPVSIIPYRYGNAWKDQLTSYNGKYISYDAIGNPTNYRGWSMSWDGRNLTKVEIPLPTVGPDPGIGSSETVVVPPQPSRSLEVMAEEGSEEAPAGKTEETFGIPDAETSLEGMVDPAGEGESGEGGDAESTQSTRATVRQVEYTYDKDGLRTSKIVGGVTITYAYQGSLLMAQQSTGKTLYFSYDSSGKALSVNYNGTEYYYLRNGQGDIVGLLDGTGKKVVSYRYDSWGKLVSTTGTLAGTLGKDNPFRYRGYYYDEETGFYWLLSRYYDPEVGRFISADSVSYLGADGTPISYNYYAYCKNNPVMFKDSSGRFGLLSIVGIIVTSGVLGGILGAFSAAATNGNVIEGAIEGCITGMIGSSCGLLIHHPIAAVAMAAISSFAVDVAVQATTQYIETQDINLTKIDYGRSLKTAVQTGLGTAIPPFGNARGALDAVATALIWGEASTLIVCVDVILTNAISSGKTSSSGTIAPSMNRPRIKFQTVAMY